MANLIEEYGTDFCRRKFAGSFFRGPDTIPCIFKEIRSDGVAAQKLTGSVSSSKSTVKTEDAVVPYDFFTDLGVFSTPALGWRSALQGRVLAYFTRDNRSYHRGLSVANLQANFCPMTEWLMATGHLPIRLEEKHYCLMAFKPTFLPMAEGLSKMREGKLLSFAASESVAVTPAARNSFTVYFREKPVATIGPDNSITTDFPNLHGLIGDIE